VRLAAALGIALALAAPAQAQLANRVGLGAGGATTRLSESAPTGTTILSGATASFSARIGVGRFAIEGQYRQGSLRADSGSAANEDLVEARVLAVVRPLSWFAIAVGPHARAYVVPGSTEHWTFIEGRARIEGAVIGDLVRTHVEGWTAFSASTNVPGSSGSAHGAEAGLTVRLRTSPVWFRLVYAIDRAQQNGSARTETLEDVALLVGFGRP